MTHNFASEKSGVFHTPATTLVLFFGRGYASKRRGYASRVCVGTTTEVSCPRWRATGRSPSRFSHPWEVTFCPLRGTFQNRAKVVDSLPGDTLGIAGCRHNPAPRAK